ALHCGGAFGFPRGSFRPGSPSAHFSTIALILRKVWACGKKCVGTKKSCRMSLTWLGSGAYIRLTNDGGGAAGGEELRSCYPRVGRHSSEPRERTSSG